MGVQQLDLVILNGSVVERETSGSSVVSTAFLRVAVNYTGDSDGRSPKIFYPK